MKKVISLLALLSALLPVPASAIQFTASLSGLNENPSNGSLGTGTALVDFDTSAHTLIFDVSFSGLTGTTTVAHIHCCVAAPGNVGVAVAPSTLPGFPVGVTSGTYNATIDLTQTSSYTSAFLTNFGGGTVGGAEAALLQSMLAGNAYFNIHSSVFSGGEIRGFLTKVPEPSALGLLLIGLVGITIFCRRTTDRR